MDPQGEGMASAVCPKQGLPASQAAAPAGGVGRQKDGRAGHSEQPGENGEGQRGEGKEHFPASSTDTTLSLCLPGRRGARQRGTALGASPQNDKDNRSFYSLSCNLLTLPLLPSSEINYSFQASAVLFRAHRGKTDEVL